MRPRRRSSSWAPWLAGVGGLAATLALILWPRRARAAQASQEPRPSLPSPAPTAPAPASSSPPARFPIAYPPVSPRVVSKGGAYGVTRDRGPHVGIDFAAPQGTPAKSVIPGVVLRVIDGTQPGQPEANQRAGLFVLIGRQLPGTDAGLFTWHMHLSKALVKQGDTVAAGQVVGLVGRTGVKHSGTHLHLQVATGAWSKKGNDRRFFNPDELAARYGNAVA